MDPLHPRDPKKLGNYTLIGRLGEGSRGVVYLGREGKGGTQVAIKLLPETPAHAEEAKRLKSAKRISSSYVARVIDAGVWEGRPYLVREHIEGRSLAELVKAEGPLTGDALERVAVSVLTALTPIHLAGMAHCGLTPQNVIIGADGPRVTDVAIGPPVGEIGYRSPEQLSSEPYGPYTDVFSWAAVVTFAATGKPPFGHDAQAVKSAEPKLGAMAEPLRGIVLSALSKEVERRPTTYSALLGLMGDKNAAVPGASPAVPVPPLVPPLVPPQESAPGQTSLPPNPESTIQGLPVPPPAPVEPPAPAPLPVPLVPQQADASTQWGPPPSATEPQQTWTQPETVKSVASATPTRKFPVGLVAAMGAVVLVSALGLWGASQYAPKQTVQSASASGDQTPPPGSVSNEQGSADAPVDPPKQQQQQSSSGQPEVTVPWAKTPEPQATGVLPFEMPRDDPSNIAVPELSTVPSPLPTQPVATQAIAQPTVTVTSTPTSTERGRGRKSPDPQATRTVQPTPTPSASATPQPQATVTVTATPTPTPEAPKPSTQAPTPTEKPTSSAPTQQAPSAHPSASGNPNSPTQVCGDGFAIQRSTPFEGAITYLLYNAGNGEHCAVTVKTTNIGNPSWISVTLEAQNGPSQVHSGEKPFFASVKLHAGGKCVRYIGAAGGHNTTSDWGNCG